MALELKEACERCGAATPADGAATICSYECTFCPDCATELDDICPNCGGEACSAPAPPMTRVLDRLDAIYALGASRVGGCSRRTPPTPWPPVGSRKPGSRSWSTRPVRWPSRCGRHLRRLAPRQRPERRPVRRGAGRRGGDRGGRATDLPLAVVAFRDEEWRCAGALRASSSMPAAPSSSCTSSRRFGAGASQLAARGRHGDRRARPAAS